MSSEQMRTTLFLVIAAIALIILPMFLYPIFLMKVMCFALFAAAFNLLLGYGGLLSFGHAAFFGMGSYTAAWLAKEAGLNPELVVLCGGAVAALMGLVFGWVAIRRQGLYFAMITLGLAQMVYFFCVQAPFTGGEDGIQKVPRGALFGLLSLNDNMRMYWFVVVIFALGMFILYRAVRSPFGQVVRAIRGNENRTMSLGYRPDSYKLMTFTLSAALAGVAGSTKALVYGVATLTDVHFMTSGDVVLMTLIGGLGTFSGPIIGAAIVAAMTYYLAPFGSWVSVIQGGIFVVSVLAFRQGIAGAANRLLRSLRLRAVAPSVKGTPAIDSQGGAGDI